MNETTKFTQAEVDACAQNKIRQKLEQDRIARENNFKTPADFVFKITPYVVTQEQIEKREADERAGRIESMKFKMNIPLRHRRLEKFENDQWNARLDQITKRIGNGFILALIGQRGTGKTQMAVELIERSIAQEKRAEYCLAMDFFLKVKATYCQDAAEDEGDVIRRFAAPKLLIIDEIQERAESQWEDRLMTHLINKRYNDVKDTLLISNLTKGEFIESVGSSVASRLVETGGICTCNWESFRK